MARVCIYYDPSGPHLEVARTFIRKFNISQSFCEHYMAREDPVWRRLGILHFTFNLNYLMQSSLHYVLFLEPPSYVLFTCHARRNEMDLKEFFNPFALEAWVAILVTMIIGTLFFELLHKFKNISSPSGLILVSALLEHSFEFRVSLGSLRTFNKFYITFLLGGIVLSNGYKGVLIPEIVKPIRQLGITTVAEADDANYTLKFGIHDAWTGDSLFQDAYKQSCVNLSGRLDENANGKLFNFFIVNNPNFTTFTAADMLAYKYFENLLDKDTSLYLNLLARQHATGYRKIEVKRENFPVETDWKTVQLLKIAKPVPCSSYEKSRYELSYETDCDGVLKFTDKRVATLLFNMFGTDYYEIPDGRTLGLPVALTISPVTLSAESFKKTVNVLYFDSGIYQRSDKSKLNLMRISDVVGRRTLGLSYGTSREPRKISLGTRIINLFTVSVGFLSLAMAYFLAELLLSFLFKIFLIYFLFSNNLTLQHSIQ